jgi:hypothetical protein
MTKVILDHDSSKLENLADRVEVCDRSGRTLGYFVPAVDRSLYEGLQVPFSDEELDRFEREPGGRSLPEILADLEGRP